MRIEKIEPGIKDSYINNSISYKAKYIPLQKINNISKGISSANEAFWKDLFTKCPDADISHIGIVYKSCLDPNNCINEDAVQSLYDILPQKPIVKLKSFDNLKDFFKKVFYNSTKKKELVSDNKNLDGWTSEFIKNAFNACRDKNGYLVRQNLNALTEIYKSLKVNKLLLPTYLKACKDENGIFTDENINFLKEVLTFRDGDRLMLHILGRDNNAPLSISEDVRAIISDNKQYFSGTSFVGITNFIEQIIYSTNKENRSRILDKVRKNLPFLIDESGKDIKYSYYSIFGIDGKMREENFDKIIELIKNNSQEGESTINTHILTNENGYFDDENIKQYKRLHEKYTNDEINKFCWKQGFYMDNKINPKFVEFVVNNIDKTKELDFDIYKELGLKDIKEIIEKAKKTNLYEAKNMVKLLKELKENGVLTNIAFEEKIYNNDNLMFQIADIAVTEDSTNDYDEMVSILKKIPGIRYYCKDKNGITFLERIIHAENFKLLDLVKSSSYVMDYDPMLEYAYKGIQDEKFKQAITGLKISFPLLTETAHQGSVKAFEEVKYQLDSPFCNKEKMVKTLYDIADANNKTEYKTILRLYYQEILNKGSNK